MEPLSSVIDEAVRHEALLGLSDIAINSVVIYDIVQIFIPAARLLDKAVVLGD